MKIKAVKFNSDDRPDFFPELRRRVNIYFKENNISKHGNSNMKLKTLFMLSLYFVPFACLLSLSFTSSITYFLCWLLMGLGMAGIGLSIMHDANHHAYSSNKTLNTILGYSLNFLGGYHITWRIQHNVLHHSFTNIEHYDEDISVSVMCFSPNQASKKIFRYQAFYAPLFYCIMTLYKLFSKDFEQLYRYHRLNLLQTQNINLRTAVFQIIWIKLLYLSLTLILPLYLLPFEWWETVLGFLLMHMVCGLILALIFQSAHVVEDTDFYEVSKNGDVENNWAIHQMQTTANFAKNGRIFSWLIGGLNYQIEHHLFPNICHVHYRDLSKIVRATAREYNIPYKEYSTFLSAVKSHFSMLHKLGNANSKQ